eukprot:3455814-Pleurochrysis_carterae.AAC.4
MGPGTDAAARARRCLCFSRGVAQKTLASSVSMESTPSRRRVLSALQWMQRTEKRFGSTVESRPKSEVGSRATSASG